jgi:hypothetical protein
MSGYVRHLGTLTPDTQQHLENARLEVEDLTSQVQNSLVMLQEFEAPADVVSGFKAELDNLRDVQSGLAAELATMVEDGEAPAWSARLDQTRGQIQALWARVEKSSKGAHSSLEFKGLYWGLGAAGVALAFGYVVWRTRNKKRTSRK